MISVYRISVNRIGPSVTLATQGGAIVTPIPAMPRKPRPKQSQLVKAIGERLARFRKDRGLTQVQLAKELGVSQVNISSYEHGILRLPSDLLALAAQVLQISADTLLGLSDVATKTPRRRASRLHKRLEALEDLPRRDQDALSHLLKAFEEKALSLRQERKSRSPSEADAA